MSFTYTRHCYAIAMVAICEPPNIINDTMKKCKGCEIPLEEAIAKYRKQGSIDNECFQSRRSHNKSKL